jgi:hypothetical protein
VTSDSRNHITSAELVLLDPASLAYDHSAGRCLRLKEVVIVIETLVRGNIHFDQLVDYVCCKPYEVAMGELGQMVILNLLHLSISLFVGTESGGKRERDIPLKSVKVESSPSNSSPLSSSSGVVD